ncbi:MAG: hypothetical protein ACLGHQ_06900 [Acidimicrobiia bacterium]
MIDGRAVRLGVDGGINILRAGDLECCLGRPLDTARTHVYLCGNPSMIGPPEEVDGCWAASWC